MTIRLIRTATVTRLERTIEGLKRDLAHVQVHRDLIQQRLEAAHTALRGNDSTILALTEENERLLALVAEMHAILCGDATDEPRVETVN